MTAIVTAVIATTVWTVIVVAQIVEPQEELETNQIAEVGVMTRAMMIMALHNHRWMRHLLNENWRRMRATNSKPCTRACPT